MPTWRHRAQRSDRGANRDAQLQLSHDQLAYVQHMPAFQTDIKKLYRWVHALFDRLLRAQFRHLLNRTIYLQQMSVSELH